MLAQLSGVRYRPPGAERDALAGVDLELHAGELVLLAGPSGSGKTTLLRVLCGLVPHFHGGRFAGSCRVAGLDTRHARPAEVCARAGIVFQDPEAGTIMLAVDREVAFPLECAAWPPAQIAERVARGADRGRRRAPPRPADRRALGRRAAAGRARGGARGAATAAAARRADVAARPAGGRVAGGTAAGARRRRNVRRRHRAPHLPHRRRTPTASCGSRQGASSATRPWCASRRRAATNGHRRAPTGEPLAELREIAAGFPGRTVLAAAGLQLTAGSVTALAGDNGSGKTTLARVLAGLHRPSGGHVRLGGEDVTPLPVERRFPRLAFVGQDPGRVLLRERVDDEVEFGPRQLGWPVDERRRAVAAALARCRARGVRGPPPARPLGRRARTRRRRRRAGLASHGCWCSTSRRAGWTTPCAVSSSPSCRPM